MNTKILSLLCLLLASCTTLNESLELGAGLGGAAGAAALSAGMAVNHHSPSLSNLSIGATVGAVAGILTSFLVHRRVEEDRRNFNQEETEIHFGDLPPSPFIFEKPNKE